MSQENFGSVYIINIINSITGLNKVFKQSDSSDRQKMDGCFFQQILRKNLKCF